MSMKFKATVRKSPVDKSLKYYPASASPERVSLDRIVKEVEEVGTVHESDVKAVIAAFYRRIIAHLQDGHSVNLEDLGSFRTSITGKGSEQADDVTAASIQRVRVVYTPSSVLRKSVRPGHPDVKFERVGSVAAAAGDGGEAGI